MAGTLTLDQDVYESAGRDQKVNNIHPKDILDDD